MTCDECNFYQPVSHNDVLCLASQRIRRVSASATARSSMHRAQREHQTLAVFPVVSENDWCGEFVEWPARSAQRATHEANAAFDAAAHEDATRGPVWRPTRGDA